MELKFRCWGGRGLAARWMLTAGAGKRDHVQQKPRPQKWELWLVLGSGADKGGMKLVLHTLGNQPIGLNGCYPRNCCHQGSQTHFPFFPLQARGLPLVFAIVRAFRHKQAKHANQAYHMQIPREGSEVKAKNLITRTSNFLALIWKTNRQKKNGK